MGYVVVPILREGQVFNPATLTIFFKNLRSYTFSPKIRQNIKYLGQLCALCRESINFAHILEILIH